MKPFYKYLIVAVASSLLTLMLRSYFSKPVEPVVIERTVEVYRDTSVSYKPLPTLEVNIPSVVNLVYAVDTLKEIVNTVTVDSVEIPIPITQKVYSDSTYTAYVSGFAQALDSIFVYNKTVYIKDSYKYPQHSISPFISADYIMNSMLFSSGVRFKTPLLNRVSMEVSAGVSAYKYDKWTYSPMISSTISFDLFKW